MRLRRDSPQLARALAESIYRRLLYDYGARQAQKACPLGARRRAEPTASAFGQRRAWKTGRRGRPVRPQGAGRRGESGAGEKEQTSAGVASRDGLDWNYIELA